MNIIYSNFTNMKNSIPGAGNINMMKLSNYLAQQHGYYTKFYGDEASLKNFKKIKFNEMHLLKDDRIKEIPRELWSISKLFTMIEMNHPFLHIDYDLFLFKPFDQDFFKNNIVYFHDEYWVDKKTDEYQKFFKLSPCKKNFINRSYNCAIIGGQNFKILKTICNEIIDYIISHKNEINLKLKSKTSKKFETFFPPVLVEQVWIFKLLKNYNQNFTPFLTCKTFEELSEEGYVNNVTHFQSGKNSPVVKETINKMISYLNI